MFGIPSGYEFGSLIESIKLVSDGESGLCRRDSEAWWRSSPSRCNIQVFITPT